jgi:3-oxoacyl-[acyl-carrier-protein] synthase III
LILNLLNVAPKYVIDTISELTGIPGEDLLNNPEIGLSGAVDIITAFVEVNRLGELKPNLLTIAKKLNLKTISAGGFNG